MSRRAPLLSLLSLLAVPLAARAGARCDEVLARLGGLLSGATCFESPDLTTQNPDTTPPNDSLAGLPPFAFTPRTDREVIAPDPAHRTPITRQVPGIQLNGWIADDSAGQARFLLRLPDDWNGSLVVAGSSGTRSEFNGDFAWSDYVVQEGFAYASQNKGVLNLRLAAVSAPFPPPAADPLACRLNPTSPVWVHFYDNDPGLPFTRWAPFMAEAGRIAQRGVAARYGRPPGHTYAVGTSNGGYQVRRAVESYPQIFDGGVDWEGTFVDPGAPNLLTDLPAGVLNYPDYAAGGFDPNGTPARNIRAAGYPPDLVVAGSAGPVSLWGTYGAAFWEVTQCQWQKRLDPGYDTYGSDGSGAATYNYVGRLPFSGVAEQLADFATTGRIRRPLVTVAGTMDGLLPIDHHARAYARKVAAALGGDDEGEEGPPYRLYEIQNGNHIESYRATFPQLELIEPHAQRAFDLLVDHVEHRAPLPRSQCVARGGSISRAPAQPGHCPQLLAP